MTIACYYFPNYHPTDPRNARLKGRGWSEWELVKNARPRFPGHAQPNVPLWGYTDESDPCVMAQKIAAAADHGINAFIFDWYWYNDGPFLQRALDDGFLKATNNRRLKFSLMWTNHDWVDIHPWKRDTPQTLLHPGTVTPATFDTLGDHVIAHYFQHPSYWKIEGKPYFSVYELFRLVESFGGIAQTRAALDQFRAKARAAGLPGIHLNAVTWGVQILPTEQTVKNPAELIARLGFDSVTSYVWIHHAGLPTMQTDYDYVWEKYQAYWDEAERTFGVPYYPNVTMGWDSSPRAHQADKFENIGYPFMHTISGNTPAKFGAALRATIARLQARPPAQRILNINCWNEWTEGSYLEPDTMHQFQYLEAIQVATRIYS